MNIVGDPENFKQPYDDDEDYISRTTFKKESEAAQALGMELTLLSKSQLDKMDLDEALYDSLLHLKRIKPKTEAYRRHLQYIGKQMRLMDHDIIRRDLNNVLNKNNNEAAKLQIFEKLRDKLITEGDSEIQLLIETHPHLDRQKLRQLVRSANRELSKVVLNDEGQQIQPTSKSAKELFKYLKTEISHS